ncbi:MAG: hypothetical protein GX589_05850 [Deltaproteobacteria bacterium]|nr:hypothetical protein [Deltaproteobacteria bacterium]
MKSWAFPMVGVLLLSMLGFMVLNLLPYLGFDSAVFYYGGLLITEGRHPYLDFIDNKNPGIFYLLAVPAAIWKWNPVGAVWLWRFLELLGVWLLFRGLRRFVPGYADRALALLCFWTAYTALWAGTYETVYAELPEMLLVMVAVWLAAVRKRLGVAGLCIGAAMLFRQTALLALLPVVVSGLARRTGRREWLRLCVGAALPLVVTGLFAEFQGWRAAWWRYAYGWGADYLAESGSWTRLGETAGHLFGNTFLFWAGLSALIWAGVALMDLWAQRRGTWRMHLLVLSWNVAGFFETALQPIALRHHFILWLPPLTLMTAVGLARVRALAREAGKMVYLQALVVALLITLVRPLAESAGAEWCKFTSSPDRLPVRFAGHWVQATTSPQERILVWGMASQLYLESHRHSASAIYFNVMLTGMDGRIKGGVAELRDRLELDLKEYRPRYVFLLSKFPFENYAPKYSSTCRRRTLETPWSAAIPYLECPS